MHVLTLYSKDILFFRLFMLKRFVLLLQLHRICKGWFLGFPQSFLSAMVVRLSFVSCLVVSRYETKQDTRQEGETHSWQQAQEHSRREETFYKANIFLKWLQCGHGSNMNKRQMIFNK